MLSIDIELFPRRAQDHNCCPTAVLRMEE